MYRNRIAIQKNATLLLIISDLKKNNLCSNLLNFVIFEEFWGQLQWTWLLSRLNSQVLCTNTNTTRISVTLHRCLRHTPAPFPVQTWREIQDRIPILRNSWIGQKSKNSKIHFGLVLWAGFGQNMNFFTYNQLIMHL